MQASDLRSDARSVIGALRRSHDHLREIAEPLQPRRLSGMSYASEWTIAQVLSHLGSGAEIFGLILDAGLDGGEPPDREASAAIWARWDHKSAPAQAADALLSDRALVERLESLDESQRQTFRVQLFGGQQDLAGFVRARLAEHAIHTWDVEVTIDQTATVAPDAVAEMVDTLASIAGYSGRPLAQPRRLRISTTDPAREFVLDSNSAVALIASSGEADLATIRMPSEALVRLVYGRLDADHTPRVQTDGTDLDVLRAMFPGF